MLDLHGDIELSLMLLQVHVVQVRDSTFVLCLWLARFFVDLALELVEVFLKLCLLSPAQLIIQGPLTLARRVTPRLLAQFGDVCHSLIVVLFDLTNGAGRQIIVLLKECELLVNLRSDV